MSAENQWVELHGRFGRRTFVKAGTLAALSLSGLTAAACGSGGGGGAPTALRRGGQATGGIANVFLALDPHTATTIGTIAINDMIYEGLFTLDKHARNRVLPELATASIADKAATSFEVRLRDGATFHDGKALTADDVVFSFERFSDPELGVGILANFLTFVDKVEAVDPKTVGFTLKFPTPLIEERLALVKIASREAIERLGEKHETEPVGSGPYQVTRAVSNNRVELKRFADYNGKREALLDEITMRVLLDGDARVSALQSGQVVAIEDVPYQSIDQVNGNAQLQAESVPAYAHSQLLFHCGKPPFDDVRVRQAIMWAIDRDAITESVFFGHAAAAQSQLPDYHPDFVRPDTVYTRDVERARRLLADAGRENLEIELMISNAGWVLPQGTIIQQNLADVGITAKLKPGETESLYSFVIDGSFECYLALGDASIFAYDAQFLLSWLFTGAVAETLAYWDGSEAERVERLLQQALRAEDDAERRGLYGEVQNIVAEQVPLYSLHHREMPTGWSTSLAGFEPLATPGVELVGAGVAA